ncbi:MAG: glutaminyl-peptide cyclotransferase [Gammaproteobacteria bacterium]|nr:glutaminyl-peptide cyclotransferase [Gammaproteobacteria bacterium]
MQRRGIIGVLMTLIIGSLAFIIASMKPSISLDNVQAIDGDRLLKHTEAPIYRYTIVKRSPHDVKSFTQGLEINGGYVYESDGLYKKSHLRRIEKDTGKVLLEHQLPADYFGEGMTIFKNHLYQLTYQSNLIFIYNKSNFNLEKTLQSPFTGWGLTHDKHELIMSNGTAALIFLNPTTLTMSHYIVAHDKNINIPHLNELAYINGKIYANIFETDLIAIISPVDGHIQGWINLKGLSPISNYVNPDCLITRCVLNGIAYDKKHNELWVTGKNWPYLYAISTYRFS